MIARNPSETIHSLLSKCILYLPYEVSTWIGSSHDNVEASASAGFEMGATAL